MKMTITQFKALCLGVVARVQREKIRVVISRHGRAAALLVPIDGPAGDARAAKLECFPGRAVVSAMSVWEVAMLAEKRRLALSHAGRMGRGRSAIPRMEI
jgi:prevent-host-death family protein